MYKLLDPMQTEWQFSELAFENEYTATLSVGREECARKIKLIKGNNGKWQSSPTQYFQLVTTDEGNSVLTWNEILVAFANQPLPDEAKPLADEAISRESIYTREDEAFEAYQKTLPEWEEVYAYLAQVENTDDNP